MSSTFAEADALERGPNPSQMPPVVAEVVIPEVGQSGNSRNSDEQGSSTIACLGDEVDLDPGQ